MDTYETFTAAVADKAEALGASARNLKAIRKGNGDLRAWYDECKAEGCLNYSGLADLVQESVAIPISNLGGNIDNAYEFGIEVTNAMQLEGAPA